MDAYADGEYEREEGMLALMESCEPLLHVSLVDWLIHCDQGSSYRPNESLPGG